MITVVKEEEDWKIVLYHARPMENALPKSKSGVQLNYAKRIGNVIAERALVLLYQFQGLT